jgi:hypothetical protein
LNDLPADARITAAAHSLSGRARKDDDDGRTANFTAAFPGDGALMALGDTRKCRSVEAMRAEWPGLGSRSA